MSDGLFFGFIPARASLKDVLGAREDRAKLIAEFSESARTAVSFTMNIAGEFKASPVSAAVFFDTVRLLRGISGDPPIRESVKNTAAGLEAVFAFDGEPEEIKKRAVRLEEDSPHGRLFDVDVWTKDGKAERAEPRLCLLCESPAFLCARSRAHGPGEILARTDELLARAAAAIFADMAAGALEKEVRLTPKPGLVDLENPGSHKDMDAELLFRSVETLKPYFGEFFLLGYESIARHSEEAGFSHALIEELRSAGIEAEKDMMVASRGVNTHRGAIYAFGILLFVLGAYAKSLNFMSLSESEAGRSSNFLNSGLTGSNLSLILSNCGKVADLLRQGEGAKRTAAQGEYPPASVIRRSHGEIARELYGAGGAREEAARGFPSAFAAYRVLCESGGDMHKALLFLLSSMEDTNVLFRGGKENSAFLRRRAADILSLYESPSRSRGFAEILQEIRNLDRECTSLGISPGGAADMLSMAVFMYDIRNRIPDAI